MIAGMTYPAPQQFPTEALPVTPAPKKGWPGSAKVVAAVLAVTTLGAAAAGVVLSSSAKSDTDDVKAELSAVSDDLAQTETDLEKAKQESEDAAAALTKAKKDVTAAGDLLAGARADQATAEADRDTAQSALSAAEGSAQALRGHFPLDFVDFNAVPVQGSYALAIVGTPECTGYADNTAACDATQQPSSLQVSGDSVSGYTVSSDFFAETSLTENFGDLTGDGFVVDTLADVCDGSPSPTAFTIKLRVGEVGLDSSDALVPTLLFVDYTVATEASTGCTATSRTIVFDGTRA